MAGSLQTSSTSGAISTLKQKMNNLKIENDNCREECEALKREIQRLNEVNAQVGCDIFSVVL